MSFLRESIALGWSWRGTADEGEAGEGEDGVDVGVLGDGVEEALDRDGEVEAAREDGHDLGAAASSSITMPV